MAEYLERSTVIDTAINAEAVHPYKVPERIETYCGYNKGWRDACHYIKEMLLNVPSANYSPARCNNCGWEWNMPYCPYCGMKMEAE